MKDTLLKILGATIVLGTIPTSMLVGVFLTSASSVASSAHASDWTGKVKAWPQNETLLGTSTQSVPYATVDLHGKVRQAVTWVGTETIQREDGTCYTVTREKLSITPQGKAQRVTVQETLESVDCPVFKAR